MTWSILDRGPAQYVNDVMEKGCGRVTDSPLYPKISTSV